MKPFRQYFEESDPLVLRLWQSGRELFHSNVLAYLIDDQRGTRADTAKDNKTVSSSTHADCVLGAITGEPNWKGFHLGVLREKSRIDLLVIALPCIADPVDEGEVLQESYWTELKSSQRELRLVVIENKFKSLPDLGQLRRYNRKFIDELFGKNESRNSNPLELKSISASTQRKIYHWWLESRGLAETEKGDSSAAQDAVTHNPEGDSPESNKNASGLRSLTKSAKAAATDMSSSKARDESGGIQKFKIGTGGGTKIWRAYLQPTIEGGQDSDKGSAQMNAPTPGRLAEHLDGWAPASYERIVRCIPELGSDTLGAQFVSAYRDLCLSACSFHSTMINDLTRKLEDKPVPYSEFDKARNDATQLRLGDFVDKWRYSVLEFELRKKLSLLEGFKDLEFFKECEGTEFLHRPTSGTGVEPAPACIGRLDFSDSTKAWIETYASFSRGTGMVGANIYPFFVVDGECEPKLFNVGLQLQGNRLKVLVGNRGRMPSKGDEAANAERDRLIASAKGTLKLFKGCAPELKWNCDDKTRELSIGTYGSNQKISCLEIGSPPKLKIHDGHLVYYFCDVWNKNGGFWKDRTLEAIACEMAGIVRKILQVVEVVDPKRQRKLGSRS